jgi:hypothetical protein
MGFFAGPASRYNSLCWEQVPKAPNKKKEPRTQLAEPVGLSRTLAIVAIPIAPAKWLSSLSEPPPRPQNPPRPPRSEA